MAIKSTALLDRTATPFREPRETVMSKTKRVSKDTPNTKARLGPCANADGTINAEGQRILEQWYTKYPKPHLIGVKLFPGTIRKVVRLLGADDDELTCIALYAAVRAMRSYDPSRGAFSTYFVTSFHGYLRNLLRAAQATKRKAPLQSAITMKHGEEFDLFSTIADDTNDEDDREDFEHRQRRRRLVQRAIREAIPSLRDREIYIAKRGLFGEGGGRTVGEVGLDFGIPWREVSKIVVRSEKAILVRLDQLLLEEHDE
jgi:RNA polymerase sigma factor (sigma-70 family)